MNLNKINVNNIKRTQTNRNTCKNTNKHTKNQKTHTHLSATNTIYQCFLTLEIATHAVKLTTPVQHGGSNLGTDFNHRGHW